MSFELSLVSSILTAIVTVITVTAVIHLGNRQRTLRRRGYVADSAASRTFQFVLPAIFWACATDAAGFISLAVSGVAPVREFGYMMAIASLAVWIGILFFAPLFTVAGHSSLWNFPALDRFFEPRVLSNLERKIRKACLLTAVVLVRRRRGVIVVAIIVSAMTSMGISRLEIESSFLRNFRQTSPVVQAYQMVESELSGAGVWDVVLDAPDDLSAAYLESVRQLEQKLRSVEVADERLTKVLSLADADRIATAVPLMRMTSPAIRLSGMRSAIPTFVDALLVPAKSTGGQDASEAESVHGENRRKLRIMLRSREHIPTESKLALIQEVQQVVADHTASETWIALFSNDHPPVAGRVTGYYVLLAQIVSQLIRDQWRCLALAAALVWLLLAAATRSLKLATIGLIPNLLPVLGVIAVLGWSGTKMNMGAAMIAAVSIGLSIDGSVHFLANYRRKLQRFRGRYHGVLYAQKQIGLPLLMSTIALVIGFLALATSEFIPTATFGLMTAAALIAGTLTNLTLLPALLSSRPE
jgi:predicted RND superfamily exporter protein